MTKKLLLSLMFCFAFITMSAQTPQNSTIITFINVTADNTVIGSNVVSDRDQGPVVVENGSSVISSRYGVTINGDFEVKSGAALEITAN